mgnify:CR=1 FL=1
MTDAKNIQRGLKDYIRTGALTLLLAGPPAFLTYAHFDTAERVRKTTIEMESRQSQEEELVNAEVRYLRAVGIPRSDAHAVARGTPLYKAWKEQQQNEERATLDYLICNPDFVTRVGLFTDFARNIISHPETLIFGIRLNEAVKHRYCNNG